MEKFNYYVREIMTAVTRGLVGYFKAAVKLAGISFLILAVGLLLFRVDFWFLKAAGIAVFDLVPVLGSGLIMIPWALAHLLLGNTTLAWQLALLYIVLILIRQVAEPFLTGKAIGVRPLYTFLATVVCMLLFGPLGAVVGAVAAIVIKALLEVKSYRASDHNDGSPFY